MKQFKAIEYAYPTSHNAELLGSPGYYVATSIDGNPSKPHIGYDVFEDIHDPDLMALFNEIDGEQSRWCMYRDRGIKA